MAEETIWVVSNRSDAKVAVSDPDDAHPGGWAYVAASPHPSGQLQRVPVEVAKTPRINAALRESEIVQVSAPPAAERKALADALEAKRVGPPKDPRKPADVKEADEQAQKTELQLAAEEAELVAKNQAAKDKDIQAQQPSNVGQPAPVANNAQQNPRTTNSRG